MMRPPATSCHLFGSRTQPRRLRSGWPRPSRPRRGPGQATTRAGELSGNDLSINAFYVMHHVMQRFVTRRRDREASGVVGFGPHRVSHGVVRTTRRLEPSCLRTVYIWWAPKGVSRCGSGRCRPRGGPAPRPRWPSRPKARARPRRPAWVGCKNRGAVFRGENSLPRLSLVCRCRVSANTCLSPRPAAGAALRPRARAALQAPQQLPPPVAQPVADDNAAIRRRRPAAEGAAAAGGAGGGAVGGGAGPVPDEEAARAVEQPAAEHVLAFSCSRDYP